jgi:hypothetical protein
MIKFKLPQDAVWAARAEMVRGGDLPAMFDKALEALKPEEKRELASALLRAANEDEGHAE